MTLFYQNAKGLIDSSTHKHHPEALDLHVGEAERLARRLDLAQKVRGDVRSARTYFDNHRHQMDDHTFVAEG